MKGGGDKSTEQGRLKQTTQLFGGRHTHQKKMQGNRGISGPRRLGNGSTKQRRGRNVREEANNFSFMHVDFEVLIEHQGGATHQLEKQVLEQTTVYCKIPKYVTGLMKEFRCSFVWHQRIL